MKKFSIYLLILLTFLSGCSNLPKESHLLNSPQIKINKKEQQEIEKTQKITKVIKEKQAKKLILFDESITFSHEYIESNNLIPYVFYTPSTADPNLKLPLIIWLHSDAEIRCNKDILLGRGLPKILNEWELEGFSAYIACPHMTGNYVTKRWNREKAAGYIKDLLDELLNTYNIDTTKIIVIGHSLGGQGAIYMGKQLEDYFTKAVSLSGYNCYPEMKNMTIPVRAYCGMTGAGEDPESVKFTRITFPMIFGKENSFSCNTWHGAVPKMALNLDEDNNNRSDLLEWMLS